jgi:Ca-activated chloride channel family protein
MKKSVFLIACLFAVTCAALAYSGRDHAGGPPSDPVPGRFGTGLLNLTARLIQDKIHMGGDGTVGLALTFAAQPGSDSDRVDRSRVDMVIVLDRSGSMQGAKIAHAKRATLDLLASLSPEDRVALVSYSDDVRRHCGLTELNAAGRAALETMVHEIVAAGATNLGGGLQEGIHVLLQQSRKGNAGKVILISDGLANRGVTQPATLGNMAFTAAEKAFAVSTVGVGAEFNEQLMTNIADRGAGTYHYLENPGTFAEVFLKEFFHSREVMAAAVEVRIPLPRGASLIHAAGYPVEVKDGCAVFHPGELRSGQTRKLFLTFRFDTAEPQSWKIENIAARYFHKGEPHSIALPESFHVACVKDPREAVASIHKNEWEQKVLREDYSRLKEEVAHEVRKGNKKAALGLIDVYRRLQQEVNASVNSPAVASNLEKDLDHLRQTVDETFAGTGGEVAEKQKSNAKALQYDGYMGRRAK